MDILVLRFRDRVQISVRRPAMLTEVSRDWIGTKEQSSDCETC